MVGIAIKMFLVVTIPVILGILIRKFASNFIASKTKTIQRISVGLFVIVFISIWVEEWDKVISFITRAGLIALTLNVLMMLVGFYVAKSLIKGMAQRKCISLECGLQNGTLAVFVATQLVDDIVYLVPTAAYALIMFLTSIIFVFIVKGIK
tara:strand:- start:139 stop:591 length:453 start_codon:yes stop_codon:yes gene_type:complete